ncbi:hypothetical protein L1987_65580 [Smallanthus sonchifolius]|uniref:Uncharacterized protein n=1 Tax=Smallanthus sonchifolius TaxID=185202 RepID=A0ACB9BUY1_9ASTR|nr:hypothetical protein L1987_65580 [Smallanthus sonchifolius]
MHHTLVGRVGSEYARVTSYPAYAKRGKPHLRHHCRHFNCFILISIPLTSRQTICQITRKPLSLFVSNNLPISHHSFFAGSLKLHPNQDIDVPLRTGFNFDLSWLWKLQF